MKNYEILKEVVESVKNRKLTARLKQQLPLVIGGARSIKLPETETTITFIIHSKRVIVAGIHSNIYKNGNHALFLDLDRISENEALTSAYYLNKNYDLGQVHVYESSPKKYWILSFPKNGLTEQQLKTIINDDDLPRDKNYISHFEQFGFLTLRITPVASKVFNKVVYRPELKATIGKGEQNEAAFKLFQKLINDNLQILRNDGFRVW